MRNTTFKTLTLGVVLLIVGCASATKTANTAMQIERGMSYGQVLSLVSDYPLDRTFRGRGTALQYCTENRWDEVASFGVVWLVDDKVEGLTQYQRRMGALGSGCQFRFREIDWGQAPYDVKIALDIR